MPTVSYGIANSEDDIYSYVYSGSDSIDVDFVQSQSSAIGTECYGGFRFLGVAVPAGATITSATLTLKVIATQGATFGKIKGVNVDNAPTWTTANVPHKASQTIEAVDVVNTDAAYNVAAIVQAIVSRVGWASGNNLAFIADPTGGNGQVMWTDYWGSTVNSARLIITYEAGGPDVTAPTITSDDSPSVVEGDALTHALTANETVTWTKVGGADAAAFTLTGSTLSLPAQTYPIGPFVVVVRATDAAGNWTEQTITVSVTQAPLIRFIGASVGTTSATIKPHQPGDLIVAFAFRDGSATLPTLPAGQDWSSALAPTGANTCSMRLVAKIADTSSEATGTFTSATSLIVHVYRPRPGTTLSVGAAASAPGASTTVSFPALTLQDASGNSFVAGFVGHRSVNTTLETPPTGMVNRSTVVDATDEAAGHDTNGGVTSWSLSTKAVGGTSSGWFGATVEIKVALAVTARPTFQAFIIG